MKDAEDYATEAEAVLACALRNDGEPLDDGIYRRIGNTIAAAQVYATLALAAATRAKAGESR